MNKSPANGIWRIMPDPVITEMLAQSGLDFQILDCEHGGYDYSSLLVDILACQANACLPLVRVSGTSKVEIQRCLDMGAKGIVFPQLQTVGDFSEAASMMDYAPAGCRGYNPFVRSGGYGFGNGHGQRPLFVPIIETLSAVEQIDEILQIERIDVVYLGTYDLSAKLGHPGEMQHPEVLGTVDKTLAACARHRVTPSLMALTHASARDLRARGVTSIVHGVDTHRIKEKFMTLIG